MSHIQSASADGLELRGAHFPERVRSESFILFCHGVAHQANFFDEWSTHLALEDGIRSAAVSYRGHGRSGLGAGLLNINELQVEDYKQDILAALVHCGKAAKAIVCVGHSMGARVLYELFHSQRLPETVKGVVMLNPVPHTGVLLSATKATCRDFAVNLRPTPLAFPYALLCRKDIGEFFRANPQRTLSILFSSDSEQESRLLQMSAAEFCASYISDESVSVVREVLFPSRVRPRSSDIPLLIVGSRNDRLISPGDLVKMKRFMEQNGYHGTDLRFHTEISHDSPLDIEGHHARESIMSWMKNSSLL